LWGRLPACATATPLTRKLIGLEAWAETEQRVEHTISALSAKQLGLWNDFPELDPADAAIPFAGAAAGGWPTRWPPLFLMLAVLGVVCACLWVHGRSSHGASQAS
jgi:hypothetical protein